MLSICYCLFLSENARNYLQWMSSICKHWVCIRGREHNFPLQHKCVCLMAGASISVNTEPRYQLILVQPIKSKETETLHSASCPCKALKRERNEWNVGDVLLTRLFWHKIFISQISQLLARNFKFDLKSHGYYPVTTWVVPRLVLVFPLNQVNSRIFVVVLIDFFLWHRIFPSIHVGLCLGHARHTTCHLHILPVILQVDERAFTSSHSAVWIWKQSPGFYEHVSGARFCRTAISSSKDDELLAKFTRKRWQIVQFLLFISDLGNWLNYNCRLPCVALCP